MEFRHEIIHFTGQVPFKVYLHRIGDVQKHWHQSLELLYVVEGTASLTMEQQIFTLQEDDLCLINSNSIHELHAQHCVMIALQIKLAAFDEHLKNIKQVRFDCNSTISADKSAYTSLRSLLIQLVQQNATSGNWQDILNKSLIYRLLYELITKFISPIQVTNYVETEKHLDRLRNITNYMQEHYTQKLTLEFMANQTYLSTSYLSRFFEQYMGIPFSDYLRSLRLDHAVHSLITSKDSIDALSEASGFPNTRAFVHAFRNQFNCLPSEYRSQHLTIHLPDIQSSRNNYLNMNPKNYLAKLASYTEGAALPVPLTSDHQTNSLKPVNTTTSLSTLTHTFKTLTTVGRAKELLYAEIQEMIKTLQNNIGFRYIKFHSLFGDEMMVYDV
ncbi:MAG: helix-turn-helix transcriptional regulator, partial [Vallitaleaceae bacterium]|nr:helix-turn-helix transcriptional regulator [Vallitaleaceae bacterium]